MITLILTILISACMSEEKSSNDIYTFSKNSANEWKIINDGVMGGLSKGGFEITEDGYGKFYGNVSLENNGGFTMMRHNLQKIDVANSKEIQIRLKGDGKLYQFRVRAKQNHYYSYVKTFETSGEWETVIIQLNDMYPSYMGSKLDLPNFDQPTIDQIAFLISNKVEENFELLVQDIKFN